MKLKNYLLTAFFSSIWVLPIGVNAKSAQTHHVYSSNSTQNKNDKPVPGAQDKEISLPKMNKILFTGNKAITSEELSKAIPLKSNDIANENVIMDSMVKIAKIYQAKNIKVTITPIIEKISVNARNIRFDIHEAPLNKKQD